MAKILILISADLSTSPKLQKETETLTKAGDEVIVRKCWFDPRFVRHDLALSEALYGQSIF